jgi:hypothetical protein
VDVDAIEQQIAKRHRGRKWILASDAAASTADLVTSLTEWGASDVIVVASVPGVGDLPDAPIFYTESAGWGQMAGIRAFEASIAAPQVHIQKAVDAFDPEGQAEVIVDAFSTLTEAVGRPVYAPRPHRQATLEDKMLADGIWDAAQIVRAPSEIVPVADAGAASQRLAGPMGTVWVADNKEGWHGGADYVRWVRSDIDVAEAAAWFGRHAVRVRVMPFLDGIPCSIHGWVTHDGIAVIRPLEMLVFRRLDRTGLAYGGMASFWDPPQEHRTAMRHVARKVGRHLVERISYVGPYGIDGVLTVDGFLPTELNPRLTAGHQGPAAAAGLLPAAMMRAEYAGEIQLDAEWLEETLVAAGDGERRGRAVMPFEDALEDRSVDLRFGPDGAAPCDDPHRRHATVKSGSGPRGGVVFVRFEPNGLPMGPSVAHHAIAGLRFAAEEWGLDIPPLEPAPDLYAGSSGGA